MSVRSLLLVVVFVSLSVPLVSSAQQPASGRPPRRNPAPTAAPAAGASDAPSPEAIQARELFQEGQTAYTNGNYEEAVAAWEHAYQLDPRPALQYNLAQAYGRLGDLEGELHALERFVEGAPATDPAVETSRARIRAIQDRLTRTGIRFVGVPSSAVVQVDDATIQVPADGGLFSAPPGSHHIHVRQRGHRPFDVVVDVIQGRTTDVHVTLTEIQPPHPPIIGYSLLGAGGGMLLTGTLTGSIAFAHAKNEFAGTASGDRAHRLAVSTDVLISAGAAAAITGLILVLVRDRPESDEMSAIDLRPYAGSGGAGLAITGRF